MTIQLSEFKGIVDKAKADLATQDQYVKDLGAKVQAGVKTIKVFDEDLNQWTDVKTVDFWQIQYNKYLAMAGYAGELDGLLTNLQTMLVQTLATIVLPEDRVVASAVAAKA